MVRSLSVLYLSFAVVCLTVLIRNATSNPQITFSTDWNGGKRDASSEKHMNSLDSAKLGISCLQF